MEWTSVIGLQLTLFPTLLQCHNRLPEKGDARVERLILSPHLRVLPIMEVKRWEQKCVAAGPIVSWVRKQREMRPVSQVFPPMCSV